MEATAVEALVRDEVRARGIDPLLDPAAVRQRYLEVRRGFEEQIKEGFRRHQVDYLPLPTDEPHSAALRSYLALRMR